MTDQITTDAAKAATEVQNAAAAAEASITKATATVAQVETQGSQFVAVLKKWKWEIVALVVMVVAIVLLAKHAL